MVPYYLACAAKQCGITVTKSPGGRGQRQSLAAASAPHDRRTPHVQRIGLVLPFLHRPVMHDFQLGGNLDHVAVAILDEDEEVVAWPVAARSPDDRNAHAAEMVGPILDGIP